MLVGVVVAVISTLVISRAQAQVKDAPKVSIYQTVVQDVIKVIYGYNSEKSVVVNFLKADGLFETDVISGKDFQSGFLRKYNVEKLRGQPFWIEISSPELSVTFKMTNLKNGKWAAHLEKTT